MTYDAKCHALAVEWLKDYEPPPVSVGRDFYADDLAQVIQTAIEDYFLEHEQLREKA